MEHPPGVGLRALKTKLQKESGPFYISVSILYEELETDG